MIGRIVIVFDARPGGTRNIVGIGVNVLIVGKRNQKKTWLMNGMVVFVEFAIRRGAEIIFG
jgi:hypothetical protein